MLLHLGNFMLKSGGQENEKTKTCKLSGKMGGEDQQGQAFFAQVIPLELYSSFKPRLYHCKFCAVFAFLR